MKPFVPVVAAAAIAWMPATIEAQTAVAQTPANATKWVTSWAASAQGPYPVGNPSAQPDQRFAFPDPEKGARNQTFRMMVRPDVWGRQARLRFSNAFGTKAVTFRRRLPGARPWRASARQRPERRRVVWRQA